MHRLPCHHFFLLHIVLLVSLLYSGAHGLSRFIKAFEPLSYGTRETRSAADDSLRIAFRAFDRDFRLRLKRDTSVFDASHVLHHNDVKLDDSFAQHYEGVLDDDVGSSVFGSVVDGVFDGQIATGDDELFHVERAAKYVGHAPVTFHSVVYKDSHVKYELFHRHKRNTGAAGGGGGGGGCALDGNLAAEMSLMQQQGALDDVDSKAGHLSHDDSFPYRYFAADQSDRHRRQTAPGARQPGVDVLHGKRVYTVRTCSLYIQADQKLYEHVLAHAGHGDATRTREEILNMIYTQIKAVNFIYGETSFQNITGINFVVQRTSIYDTATCKLGSPVVGSSNPFCAENVDVSNFLNLNSKQNHSSFCLAYALTYRDFVGGTLGLAWVASPQANTAGGVCQVYQRFNERRGSVMRSLNTGIVTLVNYGSRVPDRVSQLTLAHEIGHNFGSPHDYPLECQPAGPDGNYIMYASATTGNEANNKRFSKCSVANISLVLFQVLAQTPVDPQRYLYSPSGGKRNCFSERTTAFCGNQLTEPGEQCDCGFNEADCAQMADRCCWPHQQNGVTLQNGCTRRGSAKCSPSEGFCCNPNTCGFKPSSVRCSSEGECTLAQTCDGRVAVCPPPPPRPDSTTCQENTKVCRAGSCNTSICALVGLESCSITIGSPEQMCQLACWQSGKCVPSFELPELSRWYQEGREGILLRPGSVCNDLRGYCDIFRKCRSVDSNGPLSRLTNLLFNEQTYTTVREWVEETWWAVVLMGMALVLLMALFIKCCAVHTPSTNPSKVPALNIYDTLRRPTNVLHPSHPHQRRSASRGAAGGGAAARPRHHRSRPPPPSAPPSAPPPMPAHVIVIEPPPDYSAAVARDPQVLAAESSGLPKRGHRKHRRPAAAASGGAVGSSSNNNAIEMRPKRP